MNRAWPGVSDADIAGFCRRWQVTELALLGSILREDFGPESDVDVLVTFAHNARWGGSNLIASTKRDSSLLEPLVKPEGRSQDKTHDGDTQT